MRDGNAEARVSSVDPISFEVIRHKLQAIVAEQAITLKAVSGSPVVTDATDFNCGLYLADGSIVTMGPQVIFHAGTMSTVIRSIIRDFGVKPGIREGDMFILNDPYRGAIHQPDISIVAPIFHDGEHVAWAGSCAHQLDTGGMSFGSWAYQATEIQQEAMLLPGVKIVENGELREDLWQMIMGMTRLPHVLGLDLKAMIAANTIATRRFLELLHRYGEGTVVQVMREELDASERHIRARLRDMPDGVYRARDFLEHDGHTNALYQVCVAAEKRGDTLTFDMEGTSPQAPGFINCTYSGLRGALFAGLLPILAPDMRWNEGILRAVSIRAPEASLCNARWPAPVSGATVCTAWVVQNVTVAALSRMVACSRDWAREGQAVTKGHMMVMTLAGRDRAGGPYGTFLMDSLAGGGGAFIDHDGLDGSGDYSIPRPAIANVETNEAAGPLLYLFRTFLPDTGGPGQMRGGVGAGVAITPYDTESLHAMVIGHGVEVPNSIGLFGGMPGACGHNFIGAAAAIDQSTHVPDLADGLEMQLHSATVLGAKPGNMALRRGQVLGYTFQGGGGYGDPLCRDVERVVADALTGFVSLPCAEQLYGVVIRDGTADLAATATRRNQIRRERLGGRLPQRQVPDMRGALHPSLRVTAERHLQCVCGRTLAEPGQDWKHAAVSRRIDPEDCGPHLRLHSELTLREFICPDCATLLEVEVLRGAQSPIASVVLDA